MGGCVGGWVVEWIVDGWIRIDMTSVYRAEAPVQLPDARPRSLHTGRSEAPTRPAIWWQCAWYFDNGCTEVAEVVVVVAAMMGDDRWVVVVVAVARRGRDRVPFVSPPN